MEYWRRAAGFAYGHAQKFAVWKVIPTVAGAGLSLLLHLQPGQQVLTTIAIAIGCYVLLYAGEFAWYLLIKAPVAIDQENRKEISSLSANLEATRKRPYDQEHEKLVRGEVSALSEDMRNVLRYILHHPDVEARSIPAADSGMLARECYNRGFLDMREHRPGNGLQAMATYYTVKQNIQPVLKEFFYPKNS